MSYRVGKVLVFAMLLSAAALPLAAQGKSATAGSPEVTLAEHAVSPPVRDLPTMTEVPGFRIKPLRRTQPVPLTAPQPAGALQTSVTLAVATTAEIGRAHV